MPVQVSFFIVVAIWSTTPLGIVWSSESMSPTLAVFLRMLIALIIGIPLAKLLNIRTPWDRSAVTVYGVSAIGVYGGMMLSYFAAQHIPSGLLSLIFGTSPMISGLLAQRILNEPKFDGKKWTAVLISLLGLYLVCERQLDNLTGVSISLLLVFAAVFCFCLSGVLIKKTSANLPPMATTLGCLTIVTPLYFITWLIVDGSFTPTEWSQRSIIAIAYLGVFGSLIGFLAYFHVLQKLAASTVALITLQTPILALFLGAWLNDEPVDGKVIVGALLVVVALGLFQFGNQLSLFVERRFA